MAATKYQPKSKVLDEHVWRYKPELYKEFTDKVLSLLDSDRWREYLGFQRNFHNYSFNNSILISLQKPDATHVASYETWKRLGRYVNKKETGISILTPVPFAKAKFKEKELEEEPKAATKEDEAQIKPRNPNAVAYFKLGRVFDITQTAGREVPKIANPLGGAAPTELVEKGLALAKCYGYTVEFQPKEKMRGAHGHLEPGKDKIVLVDSLSEAQRAKTLFHELAHGLLHDNKDTNYAVSRPLCELEAESAAFLVCGTQGLDSTDYSLDYAASWVGAAKPTKAERLDQLIQAGQAAQKAAKKISHDLASIYEPDSQPIRSFYRERSVRKEATTPAGWEPSEEELAAQAAKQRQSPIQRAPHPAAAMTASR